MDNSWIENVILNFFKKNVDIFGKGSTYHGFETKIPNQYGFDGFQSVRLNGTILYKDEQGRIHESAPIFIKQVPERKAVFDKFISFSFANEINFFVKIIPFMSAFTTSFSSLFPKFYHGEMMLNTKENHGAIIFEDLKARGYKMAEKYSFLDYQHLSLMVRKLGEFHAYSYKAKANSATSNLLHPIVNSFQETNHNLTFVIENHALQRTAHRGFELLRQDPKYQHCIPHLEKLVQDTVRIYRKALIDDGENPTSVIIHGDYMRSNVMFLYKNGIPEDMVMIDMANTRYASPAIDLGSILYFNADQSTRDKYWDILIDEYYTALKETFPNNGIPSKTAILQDFIGKCFCTYLDASHYLPFLMAMDNDQLFPQEMDPHMVSKYREGKGFEIPQEIVHKICLLTGGAQGTQALKDILKDMIDRGFIGK